MYNKTKFTHQNTNLHKFYNRMITNNQEENVNRNEAQKEKELEKE